MIRTKNSDTPIYEPFVDDEGQWVSVEQEYPDGHVLFSDGTLFYPRFDRGADDNGWVDTIQEWEPQGS